MTWVLLNGVHPVPESLRKTLEVRANTRAFKSEHGQWVLQEEISHYGEHLGRALKVVAPERASLVYGAIGALGYFADNVDIYDRYGLVTALPKAVAQTHGKLRSPGHDVFVPVEYFADHAPTYLRADLFLTERRLRLVPAALRGWAPFRKLGYAPKLYAVDLTDGRVWLMVLQKSEAVDAEWDTINAQIPVLRRGKSPPGVSVVAEPVGAAPTGP